VKFGLYLVRNGIISAEELVGALEVQNRTNVPIGQLAIEERLMSAREVFQVLHHQRDMLHRHELFGEIAVDKGFITHDELQRLLVLQMDRKPPLEDVLVEQGVLTRDEMNAELQNYRQELDRKHVVTKRRLPLTRPIRASVPSIPDDAAILDESEMFELMR
jgi:hypothetical protein